MQQAAYQAGFSAGNTAMMSYRPPGYGPGPSLPSMPVPLYGSYPSVPNPYAFYPTMPPYGH